MRCTPDHGGAPIDQRLGGRCSARTAQQHRLQLALAFLHGLDGQTIGITLLESPVLLGPVAALGFQHGGRRGVGQPVVTAFSLDGALGRLVAEAQRTIMHARLIDLGDAFSLGGARRQQTTHSHGGAGQHQTAHRKFRFHFHVS